MPYFLSVHVVQRAAKGLPGPHPNKPGKAQDQDTKADGAKSGLVDGGKRRWPFLTIGSALYRIRKPRGWAVPEHLKRPSDYCHALSLMVGLTSVVVHPIVYIKMSLLVCRTAIYDVQTVHYKGTTPKDCHCNLDIYSLT